MNMPATAPTIEGIGAALGSTRVRSDEIERRLGLESGWIQQRTGIIERPYASADEATSDLAVRAGAAALEDAGVEPGAVKLLLLATSTPDHPLPPTAPEVASRLGLVGAGAIDLAGACAGFCYALALADAYARAWSAPIIVVAANVLSRRLDHDDPATAALFADGAGAAVLMPGEAGASGGGRGIRGISLGADGSLADTIVIPAGGSRRPVTHEALEGGEHLMRMQRGPALFHAAAHAMADAGLAALKSAGAGVSDIDVWVPHQAGRRLMEETRRRLEISKERTVDVVDHTGNASAATIPIALAAAASGETQPSLHRGDDVLLTAVGAGLISAGVFLRW